MTPEQIRRVKDIEGRVRVCERCGIECEGVATLCYSCREDRTPQQVAIDRVESLERLRMLTDKLEEKLKGTP